VPLSYNGSPYATRVAVPNPNRLCAGLFFGFGCAAYYGRVAVLPRPLQYASRQLVFSDRSQQKARCVDWSADFRSSR
jgi:hypothetical protein